MLHRLARLAALLARSVESDLLRVYVSQRLPQLLQRQVPHWYLPERRICRLLNLLLFLRRFCILSLWCRQLLHCLGGRLLGRHVAPDVGGLSASACLQLCNALLQLLDPCVLRLACDLLILASHLEGHSLLYELSVRPRQWVVRHSLGIELQRLVDTTPLDFVRVVIDPLHLRVSLGEVFLLDLV